MRRQEELNRMEEKAQMEIQRRMEMRSVLFTFYSHHLITIVTTVCSAVFINKIGTAVHDSVSKSRNRQLKTVCSKRV